MEDFFVDTTVSYQFKPAKPAIRSFFINFPLPPLPPVRLHIRTLHAKTVSLFTPVVAPHPPSPAYSAPCQTFSHVRTRANWPCSFFFLFIIYQRFVPSHPLSSNVYFSHRSRSLTCLLLVFAANCPLRVTIYDLLIHVHIFFFLFRWVLPLYSILVILSDPWMIFHYMQVGLYIDTHFPINHTRVVLHLILPALSLELALLRSGLTSIVSAYGDHKAFIGESAFPPWSPFASWDLMNQIVVTL